MPVQHYIKYAYESEEASISKIARRTGVSWRTAAKYARRDDWNEPIPGARAKRRPVMDPVAETVDTWLLEDRLLPRKDRRNAAAIYRELRDAHGFKGGERTVREYVQKRRGELFKHDSSAYVELDHPIGEAQADFGTVRCVRDGKIIEIKSLVLSFPWSNAGFAVPMPSENTECFLEGLKLLFEQAGGVPRRLVLDNMSAAVASIASISSLRIAFSSSFRVPLGVPLGFDGLLPPQPLMPMVRSIIAATAIHIPILCSLRLIIALSTSTHIWLDPPSALIVVLGPPGTFFLISTTRRTVPQRSRPAHPSME